MDTYPLTVKTVRDGPVCTLILRGDLDFLAANGFVEHAARVVDDRTERFVLDLAGLTFLDCAGVRALMTAMSIAPSGCPVIIRSLSRPARRVIELLDLDLDNLRESSAPGWEPTHELDAVHAATSRNELAPVESDNMDLDA